MTTPRDPETVLGAWLDEGPMQLPSATRDAIVSALPTTPQVRGAITLPWRSPMLANARLILAAALVAAAAILGALVFSGGGHTGPVSTAASPTPPATTPAAASKNVPPRSPASSFAPFGYPGGGTITYTTHDEAGNDTLWIVDPSGSNARELVPGGCCGLFSPDGTELAVAKAGVAPPGTTRDPSLLGVEVFDHPGASPKFTIPTSCVACPLLDLNYEPDDWSPDGRYVAMDTWSNSNAGLAGMTIADRDYTLPWDTVDLGQASEPDIPVAFSPDSSRLLFMRTETTAGPTSIGPLYVLQIASRKVTRVSPPGVTIATNGLIQAPASWSPDGQVVVYAGQDQAGDTSIYAWSETASLVRSPLIKDAAGASSARFSPDGSWIAFDRAGISGSKDVVLVKPDGSGETNLTADFVPGVCCGQWSPDGRALLVAGTTSDDDHNLLYIVSAAGDGIWQVTTTPNVTVAFLWGAGFR